MLGRAQRTIFWVRGLNLLLSTHLCSLAMCAPLHRQRLTAHSPMQMAANSAAAATISMVEAALHRVAARHSPSLQINSGSAW